MAESKGIFIAFKVVRMIALYNNYKYTLMREKIKISRERECEDVPHQN